MQGQDVGPRGGALPHIKTLLSRNTPPPLPCASKWLIAKVKILFTTHVAELRGQ